MFDCAVFLREIKEALESNSFLREGFHTVVGTLQVDGVPTLVDGELRIS